MDTICLTIVTKPRDCRDRSLEDSRPSRFLIRIKSCCGICSGADNKLDAESDRTFAQNWLEQLRGEIQTHSTVELRIVVEQGSPALQIVSLSQIRGFDMIVMGTHGRTGLQHLLMGSVAEAVVRRALCPVLTIHLPAWV